MRWIVLNVPTWAVGLVLIGGIPLIAVAIKYFMNSKGWLVNTTHNDVAGFQAAIVAVVYAIVVGFTIVSLYEASATASNDVSTEAADLLQMHVGSFVLGPTNSARLDQDVSGYARAIVRNWNTIAEGNPSPPVTNALNDIYATLDSYRPHTDAEADYLSQAVADLDDLSQARVARQLEAQESGSLPLILWIGIGLTSIMTLAFALIFTVENRRLAYIMVAIVSAVLAVNVFVLVELGYPFIGSVAVGPGKFVDVLHLLNR